MNLKESGMIMTTNMTFSNAELEFGKVYTSYIYFEENNKQGKYRPVILYKNTEDGKITVFKVSSQLHTPFNQKYGYPLKDWKECGLKKPSVVDIHPKDIIEINSKHLNKIVGEITDKDKIGLLESFVKINKQLINEKHRSTELEK